jgi:hypothetical protein
MAASVRWTQDSPPDLGIRGQKVLLIKYPNRYHIRFQGEPARCYTHRVPGQTRPCLGSGCPHCNNLPAGWTAYAPVAVWGISRIVDGKGGETAWYPRVLPLTARMNRAVEG